MLDKTVVSTAPVVNPMVWVDSFMARPEAKCPLTVVFLRSDCVNMDASRFPLPVDRSFPVETGTKKPGTLGI